MIIVNDYYYYINTGVMTCLKWPEQKGDIPQIIINKKYFMRPN